MDAPLDIGTLITQLRKDSNVLALNPVSSDTYLIRLGMKFTEAFNFLKDYMPQGIFYEPYFSFTSDNHEYRFKIQEEKEGSINYDAKNQNHVQAA